MPPKNRYKVIIDTNLWISFLIGKHLQRLAPLIIRHEIKLIFTNQLFAEIKRVTTRPKFNKYFSKKKVDDLLTFMRTIGDVFELKTEVNICRDPKDNFLLSLAIISHADFLVTGDKDLLVIKQTNKTRIIDLSEFEKILKDIEKEMESRM